VFKIIPNTSQRKDYQQQPAIMKFVLHRLDTHGILLPIGIVFISKIAKSSKQIFAI